MQSRITLNRYCGYLLAGSLLAGVSARTPAQDTTLIISSDGSAVFQKALDHRSTLWDDLTEGRPIDQRAVDAVVAIQGTKVIRVRAVLNVRERTLLRFWTQAYDSLLSEVLLGRDAHRSYWHSSPKFCCYWSPDSLEEGLLNFIKEHEAQVLDNVNASSLSASDKAFLALYLRSVLAYRDLQAFSTDTMHQQIARYLDEYAGSRQERYVREVLDYRYAPWGMGVGGFLYAGPSYFQDNMAKYSNTAWTMGTDLEIGYGKILLKGGFGGGPTRPVRNDFTYNELEYKAGSRVSTAFGHALLGYAMVDSRWLRITPFVGVSELGFDLKDGNPQGDMTYHGRQVGLDLDLKIHHWPANKIITSYGRAFFSAQHKGYSAVRIRVGYERLYNEHDDEEFGGSQFFVRIGFGCYQGAGHRIKTWKH